ncbi:MAG: GxxExxY protein [Bryobacterales bacterium]|nr:GxxExxY protein [Bryobacterales bacterium]
MHENAISGEIVDAAYRIHSSLGPGLLESAYETLLTYELLQRGLPVSRQELIPIRYRDVVYLKLSNKHLGLLINFNVALLKDGIHRLVNDLEEDSPN